MKRSFVSILHSECSTLVLYLHLAADKKTRKNDKILVIVQIQQRQNEKKDKIKQRKKQHNEMKEIDYMSQSHATESSQQHEARNEECRVRIRELR
ncbi:hypothetical protein AVEN_180188-1 [Araneus ventricosus]|uniref:Uncharacterized protein n=1 Tax=Araneus ventricosus TaxID=182803 RepID=A0A4Y2DIR3_ARAVE|nr:hypothetical protein AVEN_180188-1 [Araneus ventricosus]